MAEQSIFWTTGGAGDGASPYTQTQVTDWVRRTFLSDPATEGIHSGLQVLTGPNRVTAGSAIVYGFPYVNDANVTLTIPTPVVGTTGHRVVLRADWSARTVRVALKSSTDGIATPPALTQVANTTWEISLATLTVTTGGVITITDTRVFVHPNVRIGTSQFDDGAVTSAKIADGAVTSAKIADGTIVTGDIANGAITDAQIGARVPTLTHRRGGSAQEWKIGGTNTYVPGVVKMQAGALATGSEYEIVTFPTAFSQAPIVFVTSYDKLMLTIPYAITSTGFQLRTVDRSGFFTGGTDALWIAIGPG